MSQILEQIAADFDTGGISAALDTAETQLRAQNRYHELFEVLKMKSRHALGLDLLYQENQNLTEEQQRRLEEELLASCRDVGLALLRDGQIQQSWVYLKHLGDHDLVLNELQHIEISDENLEQQIGLLLYEGLDCEAGYALVLEHYGTCNAITTMQQALYGRSREDRQAAGRLLVAHVHDELLQNVKAHIEREESDSPSADTSGTADRSNEANLPKETIASLLANRDYLFADGSYHIDTSHLSSTVQIAAELSDRDSLELALDLTRYGQHLDQGLQYPGEPPFEDTYATYGRFFAAQLGVAVDEAVEFFRQRAVATNAHQEGTYPIEVYIDLLARVDRPADAIEATVELVPEGIQTTGRAPTLYDLSEQLGNFDRYRELCAKRDDMLGFVISLGK